MVKPSYFDDFKCLAGKCPDSCCKAGWEITVDDEAYEIYSRLDGEIGNRFAENLDSGTDGDRIFRLDERNVCPFYNCDGLCDLYIATGGQMTEICQNYPRFYEEFDGFTEAGISISCPEAARLILSADASAYDLADENTNDDMLDLLIRERKQAWQIIDACETADEAAIRILDRAARLQVKFDINDFSELGNMPDLSVVQNEPNKEILKALCTEILKSTDILCAEWKISLEQGSNGLFEKKPISENVKKSYLRYLVFRYYLKAINSEDILSQAMLICALYLLPQILCGDFTSLCRCAAKEFEHDAENRERLLDGFYYGEPVSISELIETFEVRFE